MSLTFWLKMSNIRKKSLKPAWVADSKFEIVTTWNSSWLEIQHLKKN